mmetsp:Transcript_142286/g.273370  ORF Transcript_142286/g.273370 Transcript_142286/m.273370 type:complete len:81 (-) Transcript_142286:23-265(-)
MPKQIPGRLSYPMLFHDYLTDVSQYATLACASLDYLTACWICSSFFFPLKVVTLLCFDHNSLCRSLFFVCALHLYFSSNI